MLYRTFLAAFFLSLSGCILTDWMFEPKGACETYGPGTIATYFCVDTEYKSDCRSGEHWESKWSEKKTCKSMDYNILPEFTTNMWCYTEDCETPSPKGKFSGSNSDGAGSCGPYAGPEFDIQIDSQCKAAHAYKCAGQQQGVNATCAIYNTYQSVPNCPYCN